MNEDQLDLVRKLCTQAGMIMEDTTASTVLIGELSRDALRAVVLEARSEMGRASDLLAAAFALFDEGR